LIIGTQYDLKQKFLVFDRERLGFERKLAFSNLITTVKAKSSAKAMAFSIKARAISLRFNFKYCLIIP